MKKVMHNKNTRSLLVISVTLVIIILILIVVNLLIPVFKNNNNLAKECLEFEDQEAMECLEAKVDLFFDEDDCINALKVYDDIPANRFDKFTLSILYDDAYSMSLSCDNTDLENYWMDKKESISNQLEAMD